MGDNLLHPPADEGPLTPEERDEARRMGMVLIGDGDDAYLVRLLIQEEKIERVTRPNL